jgi:eukaryotic-like serine/threonine-protein kinase
MSGKDHVTERDGDEPTVVSSAPPLETSPAVDPLASGSIPGRYAVLERLGTGAMGVVVRAYDSTLRREVALKLVRPEARSRDPSAEARLLREAQALARLAHPNVVGIYDVDVTEQGVVIAMEYVDGRTVRAWLDERERTWSEVLAVFLAAARGLAAAHASEIVHRDVKPDNILVGKAAGGELDTGRVRVTDFGLARARAIYAPSEDEGFDPFDVPPDADLTHVGTVMGTPSYMAPEQHAGTRADMRADQYGLCVSMWEALYGARPFTGRDMKALSEAKHRGPPEAPDAPVPKWLHPILARGLATRPEDRWPSMDALVEAFESHGTRVRRRRAGLALSGLAAVGLAGYGAHQLERSRRIAACERLGATIFETTWNDETRSGLQKGVLSSGVSFAPSTHARAAEWIEPWVRSWATLRTEVCLAEVEGGLSPQLHARAAECFEEHLDHLDALVDLLSEGRPDTVTHAIQAVAGLPRLAPCAEEKALAKRPALPDRPDARARADAVRRKLLRARGLGALGRHVEGLELAKEVIAESAAEGWTLRELEAEVAAGLLASDAGHYEDAVARFRGAIAEAGRRGLDEPAAHAVITLIHVLTRLARLDEADAYADMATLLVQRLDGEEARARHLPYYNNVANIYHLREQNEEAKRLYWRAVEAGEALYGPEHPKIAICLANIVRILTNEGEFAEAERLGQRALELSEKALGPDHPDVAAMLVNLGWIHDAQSAFDRAEPLFRRALEIREAALGPDHPMVAWSLSNVGVILDIRYDHDAALPLFERALAIREAALGPDHPEVGESLMNIGLVKSSQGRYDEARAAFERVITIREAAFGSENPRLAFPLADLGLVEAARGEHEAARGLLERALAIREAALGDHPLVAWTLSELALVAAARGQRDEALRLHARAIETAERAEAPRDLGRCLENLAAMHLDQGGHDEAEALYRRALEVSEQHGLQTIHARLGLARIALTRADPRTALELLAGEIEVDDPLVAPEVKARAKLAAARAHWAMGEDRDRALDLARRAQAEARSAGPAGREQLEEVDTWLARHERR